MNKIEEFLKIHNISKKTVLIGFSGGPDSCYLANEINKLKLKYNLDIILCYFNHNWRKEAKKEELFTIDFAKKINCKFEIGISKDKVKKTEENARDLRYDFFKNTALKYNTDIVLLGHNKNDNVETLIYRIIKGTSTYGLTSIPKKRELYYRPILDISKDEILETLNKEKISYMIDSSNEDIKYKRNLIRKKIFPLFKEINPNFIENIDILIKNAINSNKIIEESLSTIKQNIIIKNEILLDKFINLDECYRLWILNDYLGDKLKYRDNKTLKKLDNLILKKERRSSINSTLCLAVNKGKIYIEKKHTQKIIDKKTKKELKKIIREKVDG